MVGPNVVSLVVDGQSLVAGRSNESAFSRTLTRAKSATKQRPTAAAAAAEKARSHSRPKQPRLSYAMLHDD